MECPIKNKIFLIGSLIFFSFLGFNKGFAAIVYTAPSVQLDCYQGTQYLGYVKLWSDKGGILANGSDTLTVFVGNWRIQPSCPTIPCLFTADGGHKYRIKVSGSGNSILPSEFSTPNSFPAEFKVISTAAEEKIITAEEYDINSGKWVPLGFGYCNVAIKVKFLTPEVSHITQPTPTPTPTFSIQSQQNNFILPPTITFFKVGRKEITLDDIKNFKFTTLSKITLVGTTIPNAKVTLYIHSLEPLIVETQSDELGNWSYAIEKVLTAGKHFVQVTVTDPQTGITSDKSTPVEFQVFAYTPFVSNRLTNFEYFLTSISKRKLFLYGIAVSVIITLIGFTLLKGGFLIFERFYKIKKRDKN